MANNLLRSRGRSANYKFDRGGVPAEFGPYIGVVKNNIDPTRSGRLQVYIEQFGGNDPDDESLWRTVSYVPPFYGVTPRNNATGSAGDGTYKGNQQSYGMWFTPPDIGVQVICFFVSGDPNQGFYIGCVPDPGVSHMIPAIGASRQYKAKNDQQTKEIEAAEGAQMPVVEINAENEGINENPRFFDQPKPIHDYVYAILYNQGLLGDFIRGPISSSSQRESPSAVFGFSTPGRAIYQGGLAEKDIKDRLDSGELTLDDVKIEGRRGGHSIVLDDGDLRGRDNLIRIRTAKGHQITMSDEADAFYFIHANGQTWIELGSEGTVDVYSTNSVNVRSQGEINLHADKSVNINAGENLNIRAGNIHIESQNTTKITSVSDLTVFCKTKLGMLSDGSIALQSDRGGWRVKNNLSLRAGRIDLNGGTAPETVTEPKALPEYSLDDTKLEDGVGWQIQPGELKTIVQRAPTHEPYPYHNRGVPVEVAVVAAPAQAPTPPVAAAIASTSAIPVQVPAVSDALNQTTAIATQASGTVSQALSTATAPLTKGVVPGVAAAVNAADVLTTSVADVKVGSLGKAEITGLLAQTKAAVGQASDALSVDKGLGQFGLKPTQLEAAGFLKPGTLNQLSASIPSAPTAQDIAESQRIVSEGGDLSPEQVAQNRKINDMLSSPMVWSGKNGVSGLNNLLGSDKLQAAAQQSLMSNSLKGLQTAGLATGLESASNLSGLVQSASVLGVGALDSFVKGGAPADIAAAVGATIKGAQFSTDFIDSKLGEFTNLSRQARAAANTVDRAVVDQQVTQAIGDPKIPAPEFKPVEREPDEPSPLQAKRDEFNDLLDEALIFLDGIKTQFDEVLTRAIELSEASTVTVAQVDALSEQRDAIRAIYNEGGRERYLVPLRNLRDEATGQLREEFVDTFSSVARLTNLLAGLSRTIKDLLDQIRARATGTQT